MRYNKMFIQDRCLEIEMDNKQTIGYEETIFLLRLLLEQDVSQR